MRILESEWWPVPVLEKVLEKTIEAKAIAFARAQGLLYLKLNISGSRGWPDRLFINHAGQHLYIEFKQPGKKPTKLQQHRLDQLREYCVDATWTDNITDAKRLLHAHYKAGLGAAPLSEKRHRADAGPGRAGAAT